MDFPEPNCLVFPSLLQMHHLQAGNPELQKGPWNTIGWPDARLDCEEDSYLGQLLNYQ